MVLQVDGMDGWLDWISPGGVMYRVPYDANKMKYTGNLVIV